MMCKPICHLMIVGVAIGCSTAQQPPAPQSPATPTPVSGAAPTYWLYVANESSDQVSRIAFTPGVGARKEGNVSVGIMPADIDGPHGLTVSPDGRAWYVSVAHGTPYGRVWKYIAGADTMAGRVELGFFPASMATTPDGQFLWVVNFNLHGDPVPSSVSVVYTPTMTEIARPVTCVMPHGSRINAAGTKHYSACMHSEQLVEIDTRNFQVTNRFNLMPGHEGKLKLDDTGREMHHTGATVCSPTWAQPGRGRFAAFVYVPCNKNQVILEIDEARERRFGKGFPLPKPFGPLAPSRRSNAVPRNGLSSADLLRAKGPKGLGKGKGPYPLRAKILQNRYFGCPCYATSFKRTVKWHITQAT